MNEETKKDANVLNECNNKQDEKKYVCNDGSDYIGMMLVGNAVICILMIVIMMFR